MQFVGIILIIIICIFFAWYNSAGQKGKRGEEQVQRRLCELPEEYHVLNNVLLATRNGTTQIDHIVVSKYGIFTIETKNYRGDIYGDDYKEKWKQIIVTEVTYQKKWWKTYTFVTKNYFYNPVKQSIGHAKCIEKNIPSHKYAPLVPIVAFTREATIANITSKYHVIYDDELPSVLSSYTTVYLTDNEVNEIVDILQKKNLSDAVEKSAHINSVYAAKQHKENKINAGICPECGGNLILRNSRYGNFYGCSNYPKCRFTTH